MTTAICNTENPKEEQEAKATREIGCQAEITEVSSVNDYLCSLIICLNVNLF